MKLMKLAFQTVIIFAVSGYSQDAQPASPGTDSTWKKEAVGSVNFSNSKYSENWAAGGEDAMTWSVKLNGKADRSGQKTNWKNTAKLEYGQTKLGSQAFRKSQDEIFLESFLGYKWTSVINPYSAASLQSQFTRGYKYDEDAKMLVSNFWDPGYLTQSVGLGFIPITDLLTRLGFSLKETFSRDHGFADDTQTDDEVETFKIEPGLESITEYAIKFRKILKYESKLNVFVNFKGVEKIDGRWENLLTAQVSKYVNINFNFEMLYDYDLDDSGQRRQVLSLGLNYSFL